MEGSDGNILDPVNAPQIRKMTATIEMIGRGPCPVVTALSSPKVTVLSEVKVTPRRQKPSNKAPTQHEGQNDGDVGSQQRQRLGRGCQDRAKGGT